MEIYSIPLALEDFLPVIFSAFGFYIIARMIHLMDKQLSLMAYLGVGLLAIGGLSKASWKLIIALTEGQTDIRIMDNALFFFLASGFIMISYALWYSQRQYFEHKRPKNVWFFPTMVCSVTVATGLFMLSRYDPLQDSPKIWFYILLGMTTIFNFVVMGLAIRQARRQKQMLAVMLFAVHVVAIILLQGLARAGDRGEASQWVAQIINTISQLALVYGAWMMYRFIQAEVAPEAETATSPDVGALRVDDQELTTA